jgi:hypothetical protein
MINKAVNQFSLLLTFLERTGLYEPTTIKMIQNELKNHANYLIKNNIQTKSFVSCFSRGSLDTYLVMGGLSKEQRNQFIIFSAGFAKAIPKDFGFKVINIRTIEDPVPKFVDRLACLGLEKIDEDFLQTDKFDIEVIPNEKKGFADHYFQNPSYQGRIKYYFSEYYKLYGVKK